MMEYTDSIRLNLIRKVTFLFFAAGIALSFPLWTHNRLFPVLPVFQQSFLASPLDYVVIGALLIVFVLAFFRWRKPLGIVSLLLITILIIDDQNRLQAWVYVYILFLFAFVLARDDDSMLRYLRVIVIGIYAWSGIHKVSTAFVHGTFKEILTDLFGITDDATIAGLSALGYVIPAVEIAIAVLLFLPRTRTVACCMALLTHVFIMIYVGPLANNSNSVVYPWNLAMCACVLLLFFRTKTPVFSRINPLRELRLLFFIALCWMIPVLNFFGMWDHALSFSYYSGDTNAFFVAVSDKAQASFDKSIHSYFSPPSNATGGVFLDVNAWSMGELNVPFYPHARAFDKLRNALCSQGIPSDQIFFFEIITRDEKQSYVKKACGDE